MADGAAPLLGLRELTNFEAYQFLHAKRALSDARARDPVAVASHAAAKQAFSAAQPTLLASASSTAVAVHALQSHTQAEQRLKAARWVERKAIRYFEHVVPETVRVRREDVAACLEALRDDGADVGAGMGLRRQHKVALVNTRAVTPLQVCLALLRMDIDEAAAMQLGARIAELMPPRPLLEAAAAAPAASASAATTTAGSVAGGREEPARGAKRARAGSAASATSSGSGSGRGGRGGARAGR